MVPVLLRREFAPGATMAWLGIVFIHPYVGLPLYMLLGETRLGLDRTLRHQQLIQRFRTSTIDSTTARRATGLENSYEPMVLQSEKISGMPIVGGNNVEFLGNSDEMVNRLIADIDAAKEQVHLLYYIFFPYQTGLRVVGALEAAVRRGVKCRVLADA